MQGGKRPISKNQNFPRLRGCGGGRGAFMQGGKRSISKKRNLPRLWGAKGALCKGENDRFSKKKKNSAMGGHNVAKSK